MKLSTKSRYGTRLMLELALRKSGGFTLLGDVARSQGISEKYLWQLASALKAAGLLTAHRGVKGGFALAKSAGEITVREIVTVLEGPVRLVDCAGCNRAGCVTMNVWKEASDAVEKVFGMYTLAALAEKAERMRGKQNMGYAAFGV